MTGEVKRLCVQPGTVYIAIFLSAFISGMAGTVAENR